VFGWHAREWQGPLPYWLIRATSAADDEPNVSFGVAKRD
jgi:hypothetical protein